MVVVTLAESLVTCEKEEVVVIVLTALQEVLATDTAVSVRQISDANRNFFIIDIF